MRDELQLIRDASTGDRAAFDELVRLKRERVVRTAFQVTGDLDDAMDVAQGVFIKLWQGLDRYDPRRRFDTWLYRVTVNAAIDFIRGKGPKGALQPLPEDPSILPAEPETPAETRLDLGALQRAFSHLAATLAPKQRAAFVLREIEGLETAEVARVMGVAESTVRNHLFQARKTLKAGLEAGLSRSGSRLGQGRSGMMHPDPQRIEGYEELSVELRNELVEHFESCPACRADWLAADPSRLFGLLAKQAIPSDQLDALSSRVGAGIDALESTPRRRFAAVSIAASLLLAAVIGGALWNYPIGTSILSSSSPRSRFTKPRVCDWSQHRVGTPR